MPYLNDLKVPKSMKQPYKNRNVLDMLDSTLRVEVIVYMHMTLNVYN